LAAIYGARRDLGFELEHRFRLNYA
jgi:hypothetical protein